MYKDAGVEMEKFGVAADELPMEHGRNLPCVIIS